MQHLGAPYLRELLVRRKDLVRQGWTRSRIDGGLAGGGLRRLRRGWYLPDADWQGLWPESQHRAHVVAVQESADVPPVFCLTSAAVVLGLPLYRVRVDRVHTAVAPVGRHSAQAVVRHRGELASEDITRAGGLLCTSLQRTVFDLARLASPEVAIVCADAAMGRVAGPPRQYDVAAAERWRDALRERVDAAAGARGIRQAREIVEIMDGRSELPLESVTKLQLRRLGFAQPGLQVRVPGPGPSDYWLDIELEEAGAFYECDGEVKYTDESMRSGQTLERILLDEKHREDWVRGTTGRRVLRGGTAHAVTPAALAARLTSFGVSLPSRRARLLLPSAPLLAGQ
ncbi:hypothetical protein AB3M83_04880 [Microbacterium sp. 179-B 1A2 NHS]|uniref:hypothetical protein n=1 Tax=Microbacterium sp. 179-B 1A2 NHS TaxID=3142383 RepID=UPI0039A267E3